MRRAGALLDHYRSFSTPSRRAVAREEVERVGEAFAALSEEQREVVTLAHLVGLSRAEIGEQLGKSEGAVRVTLHRALAKLSATLGDDGSRSDAPPSRAGPSALRSTRRGRPLRRPSPRSPMRTLLFPLALAALPLVPAAQNVWVVDQAGGPGATHLQIGAAVAAATDGDTVLVRPGTYAPFTIDGKGLVVTNDAGGFANVAGPMMVRNVPAQSRVVLRGLFTAPGTETGDALTIEACAGPVWVEKCELRGGDGDAGFNNGGDGVRVSSSAAVAILRCDLFGGHGGGSGGAGSWGGSGVEATASNVTVLSTVVSAGDGAWGDDIGGQGGHGVLFWNGSHGFVGGCTFECGDGGGADDDFDFWTGEIVCGYTGSGGSGVALQDFDSTVSVLANVATPGAGGISTSAKGCPNGAPGQDVEDYDNNVTVLAGAKRDFRIGSPAREGETVNATFFGETGDVTFALVSEAHGWLPLDVFGGLLLVDPTAVVLPMGSVPAAGFVQVPVTVPAFGDPAAQTRTVLAQSLFLSTTPEVRLGPGSALTILDSSY